MVMMFAVKEAKKQLEEKGVVYTLRKFKRVHIGKDIYNHYPNDSSKGEIFIEFIGYFKGIESELEKYVENSGFKSLKDWLRKADKSRYLYKVILV